jgi:hypothetical protein
MSSGKIVVVDHDTNLVALIQMRLEEAVYEVIGAFVRETPDHFILNMAGTRYISSA